MLLSFIGRSILSLVGRATARLDPAPKCGACRCKMVADGEEKIFLIPVWTDHTYEASADFFLARACPLGEEDAIPTGQRACRMEVYQCQQCGARQVRVVDFLLSRDVVLEQAEYVYDYAPFAQMLSR